MHKHLATGANLFVEHVHDATCCKATVAFGPTAGAPTWRRTFRTRIWQYVRSTSSKISTSSSRSLKVSVHRAWLRRHLCTPRAECMRIQRVARARSLNRRGAHSCAGAQLWLTAFDWLCRRAGGGGGDAGRGGIAPQPQQPVVRRPGAGAVPGPGLSWRQIR